MTEYLQTTLFYSIYWHLNSRTQSPYFFHKTKLLWIILWYSKQVGCIFTDLVELIVTNVECSMHTRFWHMLETISYSRPPAEASQKQNVRLNEFDRYMRWIELEIHI